MTAALQPVTARDRQEDGGFVNGLFVGLLLGGLVVYLGATVFQMITPGAREFSDPLLTGWAGTAWLPVAGTYLKRRTPMFLPFRLGSHVYFLGGAGLALEAMFLGVQAPLTASVVAAVFIALAIAFEVSLALLSKRPAGVSAP